MEGLLSTGPTPSSFFKGSKIEPTVYKPLTLIVRVLVLPGGNYIYIYICLSSVHISLKLISTGERMRQPTLKQPKRKQLGKFYMMTPGFQEMFHRLVTRISLQHKTFSNL